jgi:hypothetical protein
VIVVLGIPDSFQRQALKVFFNGNIVEENHGLKQRGSQEERKWEGRIRQHFKEKNK